MQLTFASNHIPRMHLTYISSQPIAISIAGKKEKNYYFLYTYIAFYFCDGLAFASHVYINSSYSSVSLFYTDVSKTP